jgi:glycosyltransferase involved in cell wall biosynthesis
MTVTDSISPSTQPTDFLPGPGMRGLVSVIVPCFNRADIVGETIDSLLRQTYTELEVIVVDDGSTDDTRRVIASYADERLRYFYKPNGGLSAARNYGLALARGEFIAFLDSDDLWRDWKLESQMRLFDRHLEVGMIWSDMSTFTTGDAIISARHLRDYYSAYEAVEFERHHRPVGVLSDLIQDPSPDVASSPYYIADIFQHMFNGNLVHPSTAIVRRGRLRESGPFEPEVTGQGGEDYHFYFRICSKGQVAFLDAPTTLYRIHASQLSTCNRLKEAHGNLSVITHWVNRKPDGLPPVTVRNSLANAHAWLGAEELNAGNPRAAAAHLWKSLTLRRTHGSTLRLFLISMLPTSVADVVRSVRRGVRHAMVRRLTVFLLLIIDEFDTLMDLTNLLCAGALPSF